MIKPSLNSDSEDNEAEEDEDVEDSGHVMESGYHEVSTSENTSSKGYKYRVCDYCEMQVRNNWVFSWLVILCKMILLPV